MDQTTDAAKYQVIFLSSVGVKHCSLIQTFISTTTFDAATLNTTTAALQKY